MSQDTEREALNDDAIWEIAKQKCGLLFSDVLHMNKAQMAATVRAALASQQAVKGEPVGWRHKQYGHVQWRTPDMPPEVADRYTQNGQWVSFYASPPSREPQWQPIATAPKDGTDVLVMYMHIETQVVHNAFYNHDDPDDDPAWWSYDKSEVSRVRLEGFMTPTHWMPLPPPPGIHSREGESNDH